MRYRIQANEGVDMSNVREQVIEMISGLPEDCTLEDIQYHLYVREQVARGMRAAESGDVLSQAEMEQEYRQWLNSSGPVPRETTSGR
jgi:hypothetical protein